MGWSSVLVRIRGAAFEVVWVVFVEVLGGLGCFHGRLGYGFYGRV